MERDMRLHTKASIAIALTLLLVGGAAADGRKAAELMREAEIKDSVLGDVTGAIALYQRAVAESADDRATAARALLALGAAEQKIGDPAARDSYEQVVRGFGDQKEYAATARTRLAAMGGGKEKGTQVAPQRLLELDDFRTPGTVTRDGRTWITIREDGAIVRYDIPTGTTREIVPATKGITNWPPRLSPDGQRVAFSSFEQAASPVTTRQPRLMLVDSGGGTPRPIATAPPGMFSIDLAGWRPDGSAILARCQTTSTGDASRAIETLVWFSIGDGTMRVAHSFAQGGGAFGGTLSPDGRFAAYMSRLSQSETRITVLNLQTDVESQVVRFAAANFNPIWTPDGSHVLFYSDRSGTQGLWAVQVHDGTSVGEPFQLLQDPGALLSAAPAGMTSAGTLIYTHAIGGGITTFVFEDRGAAPPQAISTFSGMSASLSSDGKWIAYIRQHDTANELIVRSIQSGDERRYSPAGLGLTSPRWFPDGDRILVVAKDGSGSEQAFFALNRSSGDFARLFAVNAPQHNRSTVGALSGDGRTFYTSARSGSGPWTQVVAIDVASGSETGAIDLPAGIVQPSSPGLTLSPDGASIAVEFKPNPAVQSGRIVTLSLSGGAPREVLSGFPLTMTPDKMRWTNDGQSLVFVSGTNGTNWNLLRVAAVGGTAQIHYNPRADGPPIKWDLPPYSVDVSRDGSLFALGALVRPRTELWSLDVAAALNGR
jgi:Tol biopolymer transport system component